MLDYYRNLEMEDLRIRIQDLEAKVQNLRLSRRILMNILELSEKGKRREIEALERYNERLKRDNRRYAQMLMQQNQRIFSLEEEIRALAGSGLMHTGRLSR
ncbi:MAG: translation initiation factor 2 [bacterium]